MFQAGQQIGSYTLIKELGKGGFGEVWLAEKRSQFITKKVAVKLPIDEQVNFEAIQKEAELWEQASGHANVLPIIDADIIDGQVLIVSEYADGGSLADRLKREGKLQIKEAVKMTIGILNGLEFLHNKGIIHRDIKPANILLQGDNPRLADFGISRAMQTTIVSSAIIGTDAYMSPESFRGFRTVQTDIWSVGVVLYQLLNGRLPFSKENPSEKMYSILHEEFMLLAKEIPDNLRLIIEKALAKLPENRYQTTTEMCEDLRRVLKTKSFISSNYQKKTDLKEISLVQNKDHCVEAIDGKQEAFLETETSVPRQNKNSSDLSSSECNSKNSRPSVYLYSPEIRGLKLGMSFEELEHCFEVKINKQPDKLGCLSLTFQFDYPYGSYPQFTTFTSKRIIEQDKPFNKIKIKKYVGYKSIHFKLLDEYIYEIFFELDSSIKWNKTDELCKKVSKQLNFSTPWLSWFGNSKYISTQFFDVFALVFQHRATLKFVGLEQQKEIKNRQRNLELGESAKDNDFIL